MRADGASGEIDDGELVSERDTKRKTSKGDTKKAFRGAFEKLGPFANLLD